MHRDGVDPEGESGPPTRAGYVLLAGLPNAGKSTLLNALVGEHLSIVTAKAQTTWQRVVGIRTDPSCQMIFLDTPGILSSRELFHRSMVSEAESARDEADVAIGVVDGSVSTSARAAAELLDFMNEVRTPKAIAINKMDHADFDPGRAAGVVDTFGGPSFLVSAKTGEGLDDLLAFIEGALPEGPFLYPEDDIAAAPMRFFVKELIRETAFELYHQEIPYAVAVQVDEFREAEDPVYIAATVFVERKSQKGMIIGKRGAGVKALGRASREKIEHFLQRRVYLDLWVKVWEGWRRKKQGLSNFGYAVPDDMD